jgi:hypothetical protein
MKFKTDPESVRCMWKHHFPDIELTETKWFEKYEKHLLMEAMQTAAENREQGKQFDVVDEENVGRYVIGIIRNLKSGQVVKETGKGALIRAEFYYSADYKITDNDKARFKSFIEPSGDCLLFTGATTTGGYGRFSVAGRSINAHFFAFFSDHGYLPAPNALGGVNGLQVAHNCRKRTCCNVRHLRLTTKAVNLMERVSKGTEQVPKGNGGAGYGSTDGTDSTLLDTCTHTPCTPSDNSTLMPSDAPDFGDETPVQGVPAQALTDGLDSDLPIDVSQQDVNIAEKVDLPYSVYDIQNDGEGVSE